VGKIVVDFMIDQFKPEKFAELYSSNIALPDGDVGVSVELDGTFTLPKYEFYAYKNSQTHLILLTGDAQPRQWGQYSVAKSVLDFVEVLGCHSLMAVGGYALSKPDTSIIYGVASEPETVTELKKFNVQPAQTGMIKGAFGVMLGLGKARNMKCVGLLGSTVGTYPDLRTARNVLQVITSMFDLAIDFNELDSRIDDLENKVKRFKDLSGITLTKESQEGGLSRGYIT